MTVEENLHQPRSLTAFRATKLLVGCYLGISVLTLVAVVLLRGDAALVTDAVWVRAVFAVG
ncbi:hypothetical protein ACWGQL_11645 [Streptomyces lydicus]